jgi:hypothetical protein
VLLSCRGWAPSLFCHFKLRAASFLAHRAYIDSCVAAYAAAGGTNAADPIELCCA